MRRFRITDVPDERVEERRIAFEVDGATVEVVSQGNGRSTLLVIYPD